MTTDDVYAVFRVVHFAWAFFLFLGLIYWGIQDMMLGRKCGHVQLPPECYLFATSSLVGCSILLFSLGEIFLEDVEGGIRTLLPWIFLVPTSIALKQGAFRVRMHREAIRRGICG